MREKILYGVISILMAAGILVAIPAFAQTQTSGGSGSTPGGSGQSWGGGRGGSQQHNVGARQPGVFGTVSSISGTTLTVTSKAFGPNASSTPATTYTVNAANATVMKNGATSTVSAIASGDTLIVQGTVSGDTVTATTIRDGVVPQGKGPGQGGPGQGGAIASLQGNGEPVIGGSVSAISGDTLTVTNKSNITYSVDATNATVIKGNATSSIASITTGDNVIVQGTVSGTSVTASSVIDQGAAQSGSGSGQGGPARSIGGVFGAIGGFIQHLFGFF